MDRFMFLCAGMVIGAVMMSGRYKRRILEAEAMSVRVAAGKPA